MPIKNSLAGLTYQTPITIVSEQPIYKGKTDNLRSYSFWNNSQQWRVRLNFLLHTPADQRRLWALRIRTLTENLKIDIPQIDSKEWPSDLSAAEQQAGETLITVANTEAIEEGLYLNFDGHTKLYIIKEVISATEFLIFPSLVSDIPADTDIELNEPTLLAYQEDASQISLEYVNGLLVRATIEFSERLI